MSQPPNGRGLVGVLGGMGPAATADFYAKLIRNTPAVADQEHIPVVIWADPTVPDRVSSVRDGTDAAYPALLYGAQRMRDAGATLGAMPCHTAHFFRERLQQDSGLPFVDMVGETVTAVERLCGRGARVGVLATAGTLDSGLYQARFADTEVEILIPEPDGQRRVAEAIAMVKSGRLPAARGLLEDAVSQLRELGADIVVLACTELPLALGAGDGELGVPVLDPTDLLAVAVVREWTRTTAEDSGSR